jgi:hypothetical protein
MNYIAKIETRVAGIPCLIGVITFDSVDGSYSADSDVDYYGYTESDWEVLDRRGRPAGWLSKKLTSKESDRIETEIVEYFNS